MLDMIDCVAVEASTTGGTTLEAEIGAPLEATRGAAGGDAATPAVVTVNDGAVADFPAAEPPPGARGTGPNPCALVYTISAKMSWMLKNPSPLTSR